MAGKRRRFTAEFKKRAALDALRGDSARFGRLRCMAALLAAGPLAQSDAGLGQPSGQLRRSH